MSEQIRALQKQVDSLNETILELQRKYQEMLRVLQQHFFFQDPDFDIDTASSERKWDYTWNPRATYTDEWTGDSSTTTFWASRIPLIADTETVHVNNTFMVKDNNYTITYSFRRVVKTLRFLSHSATLEE